MKSTINEHLLAEYRYPLRFLDETAYKKLRNQHIKNWLTNIGLSLVIMALLLLLIPDNASRVGPSYQTRQDLAVLIFGIGAPLYGLYKLATAKRAIIRMRQSQLAQEHPELRPLEPVSKVTFAPTGSSRVIQYAWITFAVVTTIVFIAIVVTS